MLTKHSSHKCSESLSLFGWANDLIKYTISSTMQRQQGLIKAIKGIKVNMNDLQRNREVLLINTIVTIAIIIIIIIIIIILYFLSSF